ncbi:MAG: hypothetical protein M1822_006211 [Bathelium mastoideum]|nr:MAG: hypothetical protein M1822_006211 [Bathelium mastoideum]
MDSSVPPVVRGEFWYRDTLFVDVGGSGKRHPRATESEVKALLTGKNPRDQVGHWYEAQLIHYGLPRSKEKNTAKVRLQQALNQGKLKVSPHLTDMESQMKKDYAAAVRKAKLQSKDTSAIKNAETPKQKGRKRTNGEDKLESSKRTKISINAGDISINIDHAGHSSSSKKSTTRESKQTAKAPVGPKSAASNTTSKGKGSHPANSVQKSPSKQEPKVKKEPSTKRATPIKKERKIKTESPAPAIYAPESYDPNTEPPSYNVTGNYQLFCLELEEQIPAEDPYNCSLSLCVDKAVGIIWGSFTLGRISGVLRIDNIDPPERMSFGWRARDDWQELRPRFGRGCSGEMDLYGGERVRGWFDDGFFGPMSFDGQRTPGPLWCGRSAYSFRQEWDGFVSEAYAR